MAAILNNSPLVYMTDTRSLARASGTDYISIAHTSLVYAGESLGELIGFSGKSEFGVGQEHYLLLESSD
jgi:hypothetical protein